MLKIMPIFINYGMAAAKPGNEVPVTIVRAYAHSTDFKSMIGDELYEANNLQSYDKVKRSTPYRKLIHAMCLKYKQTQYYNTVTGLDTSDTAEADEDRIPF